MYVNIFTYSEDRDVFFLKPHPYGTVLGYSLHTYVRPTNPAYTHSPPIHHPAAQRTAPSSPSIPGTRIMTVHS